MVKGLMDRKHVIETLWNKPKQILVVRLIPLINHITNVSLSSKVNKQLQNSEKFELKIQKKDSVLYSNA